ncbi:hypothetical protein AAC387_Pa09g2394 [Persea americana]
MGADHKLLQSSTVAADVVVAKDGSGNYKIISEAVAASVKLRNGTKRFVIHVKASVYTENVEITKSMKNLMFIGEGKDSTIVTGNKNVHDGSSTFNSLTFGISSHGFIARNMTFQNTEGSQKGQASSTVATDIVVAIDGLGNYKTISEAVAASVELRNGTKRFVIRVKASVYSENVEISKSMKNLMFIGDGNDSTIVTGSKNVHDGSSTFNSSTFGSKNVHDGSSTFNSSTFGISGHGFIARDMMFQNTEGPQKGQAPKSGGGRQLLFDKLFPTWVMGADHKLLQSSAVVGDIVVAKDGSGNYKTISEAVAVSVKLRNGTKRFVIHVKARVYSENVEITKSMKNLMFIGDGNDSTIVTGSKNVHDGSSNFNSSAFGMYLRPRFIARDMTFQNTAGPQKGHAVALCSDSDFSVYYKCSFKGYQDTLYVHSQRQFYRECDVYGTTYFIFGDATVAFQNCNIYVRRPMSGQVNTVTAQGRSSLDLEIGIIIHNSRVTAAFDLKAVQGSFKTYLGRPWRQYSRTMFMKTFLDTLIAPRGWLEWNDRFALRTLYYGEYRNTGDGTSTSRRVDWPGFHVITRL